MLWHQYKLCVYRIGTVWRETLEEENLANQAKYHCWQNKIRRIVSKAHALFN